jgi:hypothetical protein
MHPCGSHDQRGTRVYLWPYERSLGRTPVPFPIMVRCDAPPPYDCLRYYYSLKVSIDHRCGISLVIWFLEWLPYNRPENIFGHRLPRSCIGVVVLALQWHKGVDIEAKQNGEVDTPLNGVPNLNHLGMICSTVLLIRAIWIRAMDSHACLSLIRLVLHAFVELIC